MSETQIFSVMSQLVQWFALICLAASLLVKVIPPPDEIPARWYLVVYNTLRRCALNSAYQQRNGGTKTGEVQAPAGSTERKP
jgi:hypothetical protein